MQGRGQGVQRAPWLVSHSCGPTLHALAQAKVLTMDKGPSRRVNSTEPEGRAGKSSTRQCGTWVTHGVAFGESHSASRNLHFTCSSGQWDNDNPCPKERLLGGSMGESGKR